VPPVVDTALVPIFIGAAVSSKDTSPTCTGAALANCTVESSKMPVGVIVGYAAVMAASAAWGYHRATGCGPAPDGPVMPEPSFRPADGAPISPFTARDMPLVR
jgi:hypothetical protein